jgi:steroid delta-isomerase-like uncharacterized protein
MRRGKKLSARPLVAVLALATGVGIAVGRLRRSRGQEGERRSSMTEANKAISRRVIDEVFNEGRLELAEELVAADYVGHDAAAPEAITGVDAFKRQVGGYRAAFSDLRISIDEQIAEGDRVVTRWTGRGTHDGELFGISPTGKQTTATGITIERIVEGRIAESWTNWDTLGPLQQLGAVPAMAQA